MKINVPHVAKLASLPLNNAEEKKFESQLGAILDYVKKLEEVNTASIDPTSQVTGLENITREDTPAQSLPQADSLSSTSRSHNGHFKVKAVLEND